MTTAAPSTTTAVAAEASPPLTPKEAAILLSIARQAVEAAAAGREWKPSRRGLPPRLLEPGASFVTLHIAGRLRGCIGSIEARQPLALDVAFNARNAALYDPRFPPVTPEELPDLEIEVSVLSPLQPVPFQGLDDLARRVQPGRDGVLIVHGWQRGLLLPQVWEHLPDPHDFLAHVALKAHADPSIYDDPETQAFVFQVHAYTQPAPAAGT
ncbi:MAG: AmmeMemoRadiSam system protein A [Caldilineales bacterium]|nr:AmmeMemoRadiSam system protein A [Caldilineales bacterium]